MLHTPLSLGEILLPALLRDPDGPALVLADGAHVTRGEMARATAGFVAALDHAGLKPGDRVGVLSRNRAEVVYLSNALALANLCVVPLHPMGSSEDFAYVVGDTALAALVFDPAHYEVVAAELLRRFAGLKLLGLGPTAAGEDMLALAASLPALPLAAQPATPDDIARIATTGGTTGKPKAILLSQRAMTTMLAIQMAEWDWPVELRVLICAPLSHSGLALMLPAILKGGVMVIHDGFDPQAVLAAIEREAITCTLLVPTMIYALLDHPRLAEFDTASLQSIYYGASSIIPERLAQGIAAFGPVFFQFYGQSEAPMTVTVMRRHEHDPANARRMASCGRPVPWVRLALLDEANHPVAPGTAGEICVQGPLLMREYLDKPEATAEAFAGGWLHTGDVAVADDDGFLRIIDRKKDMIITGGFNVYPREIEDVIMGDAAVAQVSVVGQFDPKWGEKVVAFVVPRVGADIDVDAIIARVRAAKGPVQAPKHVVLGAAMPLSGLGKPDKKAVRALVAERLASI